MKPIISSVLLGDESEFISQAVNLEDKLEIPTQRELRDSGQLIVPCAFARTGSQVYSAKSLGLDGDPARPITVFRDEADVFDEASMSSFRSVPVTIGHPKEDGKLVNVTSENSDKYQVGTLEGMPTRDEDTLAGTLVVARQDAIDLIDSGTEELSAGYTCDIEVRIVDGEEKYFQRNIRANHIAIVSKGRAGAVCRLADEDEEVKPDAELVAKVDILGDELETANATITALQKTTSYIAKELGMGDEVDTETFAAKLVALVDEKVSVMVLGKELTNSDLTGLSTVEMKRKILADHLDKDLTERNDTWVDVRFDMLLEDGEEPNKSPMERNFKEETVIVDELPQSEAELARARMLARQKKQKG